ncbi:hypothetical protein T459_15220 [Capsicum annuum]|uniref:S-protein homolog n=1 Tax=Capsicum annuum TaxID=4072 RepID=A0A2G2ZJV3_CAPAN|nr:hypothetical protein T459_15220 [Capsicum annuum]
MSLIKRFCILLTTLYFVNFFPATHGLSYELHIVNDLPNTDTLWYHCASGDKDFGYNKLKVGEDFHFSFSINLLFTTLYFCHFWWDKKQNVFDVFNKGLVSICSRDHTCYWKVKNEGFYAGPNLDSLQLMHEWKPE